jgi:septal ring factor EnvC (AmiA/AmiB activator)
MRPVALAVLILSAAIPVTAAAQAPAAAPAVEAPGPALPAARSERLDELKRIEDGLKRSVEERAALTRDIERLAGDREKLSASLVETSRKVRDLEARSVATEQRLRGLAASEGAIRRSLESRREVIADVLAALQRMGRKSPPAVLVRPEDMLSAIRSSMLLGAVLPELRLEAESLAEDLSELVRLREGMASERQTLTRELETLVAERERLNALIDARRVQLESSESRLQEERQKGQALARQAQSLRDLIRGIEAEIAAANRAAQSAMGAPAPARNPAQAAQSALQARDAARLQPRIPFADARGTLVLPVNGPVLRQFGGSDGLGGQERGLTVETPERALVTSPVDGWVAFAGPYRSYGHVLIINGGGGYHLIMSGMERSTVEIGQFILAGEPVAAMGSGPAGAVALEASGGKPLLYIELRKDGAPIDPGPWWAKPDTEKVRG